MGKGENSVTFTLVIARRPIKRTNQARHRLGRERKKLEDEFMTFATNIPVENADEIVKALPEEYRKRWCIETGYRSIKEMLAQDTQQLPGPEGAVLYPGRADVQLWRIARFRIEIGELKIYSGKKKGLTAQEYMTCILIAERSFVADRGK